MSHLRISLFGSFQVFHAGTLLTSFRSDKQRALLSYLAVEAARPHRRESLLGLLWPDQSEKLARNNLRKSLSRLRQAIGDAESDPSFLLITPRTIQFNAESDHWLDVAAFTTLLAECSNHLHRELENCHLCHHRLQAAVRLYQGEFLGGSSLISEAPFEEWVLIRREMFQRQMCQTLQVLGKYHARHGEYQQAESYIRQQLLLDPWDETAHQHLIRLLAEGGQRAAALKHYEMLTQQLMSELGVEPGYETTLLYNQVKTASFLKVEPTTQERGNLIGWTSGAPFTRREEELTKLVERLVTVPHKAIHYYTLAGDAAFMLQAITEASEHYRYAFTLAKELLDSETPGQVASLLQYLYLQYGRTLELLGRYEEAQATYLELEQLAQARQDPSLELASLVARTNLHSIPSFGCDFKQAIVLATQALQLAEHLGEQESQARILWLLMRTYWHLGESHQGLDCAQKSLVIARRLGLREQMAWTLNDSFGAYLSLGRLEEGLARLTEARGLWQELHNLPMLTDNLSCSASFHYALGHYAEVIRLADEALRISQEIDNLWGQAYSRSFIGYVYLEYGQVEQAIRTMEACIQLAGQISFMGPLVETRANLGCLLGHLGLVEEGLRLVQLACEDAERLDFFRALALGNRARLEVLAGHLAAAEATLASLAQVTAGVAFPFEVYLRAMAEAELAFARQDYPEVVRQMDALLHLLHQSQARTHLPEALHLKGRALLAQGSSQMAYEALLEAREVAEGLGSRWRLWSILFTLSEVACQRGNVKEAQRWHRQATEVLEPIVMHISEPALRTAFLNMPRVHQNLS